MNNTENTKSLSTANINAFCKKTNQLIKASQIFAEEMLSVFELTGFSKNIVAEQENGEIVIRDENAEDKKVTTDANDFINKARKIFKSVEKGIKESKNRKVNMLFDDVNKLSQQFAEIRTELAEVKADIAELKEQVDNDCNELTRNVIDIEDRQDELKAQADANTTALAALKVQTDANTAALEAIQNGTLPIVKPVKVEVIDANGTDKTDVIPTAWNEFLKIAMAYPFEGITTMSSRNRMQRILGSDTVVEIIDKLREAAVANNGIADSATLTKVANEYTKGNVRALREIVVEAALQAVSNVATITMKTNSKNSSNKGNRTYTIEDEKINQAAKDFCKSVGQDVLYWLTSGINGISDRAFRSTQIIKTTSYNKQIVDVVRGKEEVRVGISYLFGCTLYLLSEIEGEIAGVKSYIAMNLIYAVGKKNLIPVKALPNYKNMSAERVNRETWEITIIGIAEAIARIEALEGMFGGETGSNTGLVDGIKAMYNASETLEAAQRGLAIIIRDVVFNQNTNGICSLYFWRANIVHAEMEKAAKRFATVYQVNYLPKVINQDKGEDGKRHLVVFGNGSTVNTDATLMISAGKTMGNNFSKTKSIQLYPISQQDGELWTEIPNTSKNAENSNGLTGEDIQKLDSAELTDANNARKAAESLVKELNDININQALDTCDKAVKGEKVEQGTLPVAVKAVCRITNVMNEFSKKNSENGDYIFITVPTEDQCTTIVNALLKDGARTEEENSLCNILVECIDAVRHGGYDECVGNANDEYEVAEQAHKAAEAKYNDKSVRGCYKNTTITDYSPVQRLVGALACDRNKNIKVEQIANDKETTPLNVDKSYSSFAQFVISRLAINPGRLANFHKLVVEKANSGDEVAKMALKLAGEVVAAATVKDENGKAIKIDLAAVKAKANKSDVIAANSEKEDISNLFGDEDDEVEEN